MQLLTEIINYNSDFSEELEKANAVAFFVVNHKKKFKENNRGMSSKDVKHLELNSSVSNQIIRKYNNKTCKKINKQVNLIIPNQSIKTEILKDKSVKVFFKIKFLKDLVFNFKPRHSFVKINQIEISKNKIYISYQTVEVKEYQPKGSLGVDRNASGYSAVMACPQSGKVRKMGKKQRHIHKVGRAVRKNLGKKKKYKKANKAKNKENRRAKDADHKVAKEVVNYAYENKLAVVLEDLTGIRKDRKKKNSRAYRHCLHS